MPKRVNFTEAMVAKIKPPTDGRDTFHDAKVRGLILTVTPAGTKSYCLYKRVRGKPQRTLLGHHPELTVENARKEATKKYARIIGGEDPNEDRRKQRRGGRSLGEVFEHFRDNRLAAKRRPSTLISHKSRFETCLAELKDRRIDSIRRDEVNALHVRLGNERGRTSANRAIQLLRSLFNYANDEMGMELANPAARVELFKETPRERLLRADEMPKFFAAVAAEEDETFRDFFIVALYTGARRGNVQSMKWADLDLEAGTWTIPAEQFKTGKAQSVVLSPQVLDILKRRRLYAQRQYVFASHGKRGHLVEPKGAWERIRERSGLTDLRIHDLRRTLGSWQAAAGASLSVIGRSLGHTQASTTAIYARLDLEDVRKSVQAATAAIAAAANGKGGAK